MSTPLVHVFDALNSYWFDAEGLVHWNSPASTDELIEWGNDAIRQHLLERGFELQELNGDIALKFPVQGQDRPYRERFEHYAYDEINSFWFDEYGMLRWDSPASEGEEVSWDNEAIRKHLQRRGFKVRAIEGLIALAAG